MEESRRSAPDETRAFLDGVLAMPEVRLHPRQYSRLTTVYVGTLTGSDEPNVWRAAFEECYLAAIETNDLEATLAVLQLRVYSQIEVAAQKEAEAELRRALALMGDVPSARRTIETQIAQMLTSRGELDDVRVLLERVVSEAKQQRADEPLAEFSLNSVLASQLNPRARGLLQRQLRDTVRTNDYRHASIAASLGAGPALIYGDNDQAPILARKAALHGTTIGRNWRDAERSMINLSVAFASGELERFIEELPAAIELATGVGHRTVVRAILSMRLRWEILVLDRAAVTQTESELALVIDQLQPLHKVGISGIGAATDLALGRRPRLIRGLRDAATYSGLGGLLAGMEVFATGGSRASAMTIAAWGDEALSKGIVSAPDWPVHLDRPVPLVLLRLGKQNRVPERLAKAAERAYAMQHPIEAAISRLQYAEVRRHSVFAPRARLPPPRATAQLRSCWPSASCPSRLT